MPTYVSSKLLNLKWAGRIVTSVCCPNADTAASSIAGEHVDWAVKEKSVTLPY
jgi:hypothetical protein